MSAESNGDRPPSGDFRVSTRRLASAEVAESTEDARTVDSEINPVIDGEYHVNSVEEALELLELPELFSQPVPEGIYALLAVDVEEVADLPSHPRLRLLGHDLCDAQHDNRSWLWDPCIRVGDLEALATWKGKHGLLGFEEARRVRTSLRKAWPDIPGFTIRALFEILSAPDAPSSNV